MTAQDLQRLGIKLEDLQGQGIIGIQHGGTTRAIKLEDLTGGNVQVASAQAVNTQGVAQVHHGIIFSKSSTCSIVLCLPYVCLTNALTVVCTYYFNLFFKLKGLSSGVRIQHQGTTMILDAAQLQQLAQAAAAATGNSAAFERGIPITISTQGGTTINSTGITVNTQQTSTNRGGGQQTADNQTAGDFAGISNLFC